ncbi:hypothetical protein [Notoacmeibacter marinus]|uniref:hypothetical protein n=1 Tax=Notoacmeibacter marinus TaxID=1876515 RepID=UPI0013B05148|nr:hypothetical protein [Notoacmeibacter marinus]
MQWHIGWMVRQSHARTIAALYLLTSVAAIAGLVSLNGWHMHGLAIYQTLITSGITCL